MGICDQKSAFPERIVCLLFVIWLLAKGERLKGLLRPLAFKETMVSVIASNGESTTEKLVQVWYYFRGC